MRKLALLLGLTALCATFATAQNVKINELRNGTDIWIEIINMDDTNPASIGGWTIQAHWDNPANAIPEVQFTFPGGTMLMPLECLIVEETAGTSGAPMGTQIFQLPATNPEGTAGVPWFVGLPLSMCLFDNLGNGVDYMALGSINAFDCPRFTGGGTPTTWSTIGGSGTGVPCLGGLAFGSNGESTYRHTRDDTDSPDDWTNTAIANATPGVPNHHQFPVFDVNCNFVAPTVTFTASTTSGCPPLIVGLTNTSTGPCYLDPTFGAMTSWDFDAVNNPGVNTATTWHASNTFTLTGDVQLTIVDSFGAMVMSGITPITVLGSGGLVPKMVPAGEDWEGFPAFVANPCTGGTGPNPSTGWEHTRTGNGRMRILDTNTLATTLGFPIGPPNASAGAMGAVLDSINTADLSRAIVHFDGTQGGATGFRFRFSMYENADETHNEDTVFLQDGITMGNRVWRTGAFAPVPGHNGLQEFLVADWNPTTNPIRTWVNYDIVVTYAQLATAGLLISGDMTLGFSQFDNVTFEGNDGLLIDAIQILPEPPLPGNGQPCTNLACMDINGAQNANLNPVGNISDPNGPYFSTATNALNFSFMGTPNQAIILATGQLSVGSQFFGAAGQVDISPATIIADGFGGTGFLPFTFVTDPFGSKTLSISTGAAVPPGTQLTFQSAVLVPVAPFVRLSNAVQVTF